MPGTGLPGRRCPGLGFGLTSESVPVARVHRHSLLALWGEGWHRGPRARNHSGKRARLGTRLLLHKHSPPGWAQRCDEMKGLRGRRLGQKTLPHGDSRAESSVTSRGSRVRTWEQGGSEQWPGAGLLVLFWFSSR